MVLGNLVAIPVGDGKWLAKVDPLFFGGQPANNYAKWFHVIEHKANHRGQIA